MRWCKKCVYPESSVNITFDDDGVCSGCHVGEERVEIDWDARFEAFKEIVYHYKSKDRSNYDCIIPVSGGKDSYYQTYIMKEVLSLNPLLVTFNGHNYLDIGLENLSNMRDTFGVDHIFFTPSKKAIVKLNRLGFKMTGDMNWHNHAGIVTVPIIAAVKYKVPLVLWGEHSLDLTGKNSLYDLVEYTERERNEHYLRGFDWHDFVEETEDLKKEDMLWCHYPSDKEVSDVGVRGVFLGNFINWDANKQTRLVRKFGFKDSPIPFERTYRTMSNLDDRYENGIHDLLKYIKFGYGRATDHASRDIRQGYMTRDEGIEMVRKYDHVVSSDLYEWLKYVDMSEEEFWKVANSFRSLRVWREENGEWVKDNIWDEVENKPEEVS
jgi:N-acetyl sugar amidotransferase